VSLFLLSAATLIFEINLTRLFSVAQFYHFAFMVISIALLGFGASGTCLALIPALARRDSQRSLGVLSLAAGISMLAAYLLTNWMPFDSFSLLIDKRQVWILGGHYLVLAFPFFFNGLAVAILLAAYPDSVGNTYAINLTGSAVGCVLALVVPSWFGGEGTVFFSSGVAAVGAICGLYMRGWRLPSMKQIFKPVRLLSMALLGFVLSSLLMLLPDRDRPSWIALHISPYKSLSYALQIPDSKVRSQRWNNFSRVDLVRSPSIRSLPGLSYRYALPPPPQDGLFVDGDDLSPVLLAEGEGAFADYLPGALAYHLLPEADALILSPRGGLDILTARAQGASTVTAVEVNPLVIDAAGAVYQGFGIRVVNEADRSYLRRTEGRFDIIVFSLANSYHPVSSGAYSLTEEYRYTVEAFQDALARLEPGGMLVITRWLQDPPSETLRVLALAVTALEESGNDPAKQIVAFRGYQTGTFLVKSTPFSTVELQRLREELAERSFDLTYAPDIRPEETNHYNVLPNSMYYQAYSALITSDSRREFFQEYPYDVRPPTDDHPFFGHYFKWSQIPMVLGELGRTWQPFGGAGYLVIIALLLLAMGMAGALIVLPVALRRNAPEGRQGNLVMPLLYFGMIGLAFLLVEIPFIQGFILYLGHPAYALTAVLFSLLVFSGLGSSLSGRFPLGWIFFPLLLLLLGLPTLIPRLFDLTLSLALTSRLGITILVLGPVGFFMGMPFPAGIRWFSRDGGELGGIPWIWAVNGSASVVSSVLAALLALTFGFRWVFSLGALCYALAGLTVLWASRRNSAEYLPR
jgi:hypothetical protein